jgi:hypothetical protein
MRSVLFVARVQFVRHVRNLLVIALVAGITGGIAISLIAGSRRSASVVDRYVAQSIPYTETVFAPAIEASVLRSLPGVVRADGSAYLALAARGKDGTLRGINGQGLEVSSFDPTFEILEGRPPAADEPFSVLVNRAFQREFGKRVGEVLPLQMFSAADMPKVENGEYDPTGPTYDFTIVGVVRIPTDIAVDESAALGDTASLSANQMLIPMSFYNEHHDEFLEFGLSYDVQLENPERDRAPFEAALRAANPKGADPVLIGSPRFADRRAAFDTPVDLESAILLALGVAIAVAGAIVLALVLRTQQRALNRDESALRALGSTRVQLGCIAAVRTIPVAALAAVTAMVLAYALSGRYPIGVSRELELDRGIAANVAVLTAGAAIVFFTLVVCAFAFGYEDARTPNAHPRRAWLAPWLARTGAPNDVVLGAGLAFERGRHSRSMPARAAVAGGAFALAIVIGVGVFVGGVDTLYSEPAAHGWPWDVTIGNVNFTMPPATAKKLASDPRLEHRTFLRYGDGKINGTPQEILAFDSAGDAPPTMLRGRLPASDTEIALGEQARRELHTDIGSTVTLSLADGEFDTGETVDVQMTVVGVALIPILGGNEIGQVGVMTLGAIERAHGDARPQLVAVKTDGDAATLAALRRDYSSEMQADLIPARIVNLHRVRTLPLVGMAVAAGLGVVLLAYTLAMNVRARTRELGVLRALGMSTRRVGGVLAWQGAALAATIVAVGVPLGILAGTFLWRMTASSLGVGSTAVYTLWIPACAILTVGIGLICSVLPARRARRSDVATLLRVE